MYKIITGSAARYNFGAHYNKAAHCNLLIYFSMRWRHVNQKVSQQIWFALRIQDMNMPARAANIFDVSSSPLKQVTLWIDKKTFYPVCCPLLKTMSIYNTVASGNGNIEFFKEKTHLKFWNNPRSPQRKKIKPLFPFRGSLLFLLPPNVNEKKTVGINTLSKFERIIERIILAFLQLFVKTMSIFLKTAASKKKIECILQ